MHFRIFPGHELLLQISEAYPGLPQTFKIESFVLIDHVISNFLR